MHLVSENVREFIFPENASRVVTAMVVLNICIVIYIYIYMCVCVKNKSKSRVQIASKKSQILTTYVAVYNFQMTIFLFSIEK